MFSNYGIAFNGKGDFNFGNDFARNVVILGVNISSSSHTNNHKNNFLVLDKGDTGGFNGGVGTPKVSSNFSK